MKFSVLGSGSEGNCTYVESGDTCFLIDNGFSGKELVHRLDRIGCRPDKLKAILITHEHNDHVRGVGVLSRRYNLPVYANLATHRAASKKVGRLVQEEIFVTGKSFLVGSLEIHPFAISHDTVDPVGFVIDDGRVRLGYCTDTGRVSKLMAHLLGRCKGLILESNYDPDMLWQGPYPLPLKQRIKSSLGHLANKDAASFVKQLANSSLSTLVLAHLSKTNNLPQLAAESLNRVNPELKSGVEFVVSCQYSPTSLFSINQNS